MRHAAETSTGTATVSANIPPYRAARYALCRHCLVVVVRHIRTQNINILEQMRSHLHGYDCISLKCVLSLRVRELRGRHKIAMAVLVSPRLRSMQTTITVCKMYFDD